MDQAVERPKPLKTPLPLPQKTFFHTCLFAYFFTVIVTSVNVNAAQVDDIQPPNVTILDRNEDNMTLRVTFYGYEVTQVEVEGTVYDVITIQGCGQGGEKGKPQLPRYGFMLEVPSKAYYVIVLDSNYTDQVDVNAYPAQELGEDQASEPPLLKPPFYVNDTFYNTYNSSYPLSILDTWRNGELRDVNVLHLGLYAFQYNPVQDLLLFHYSVDILIDFQEILITGNEGPGKTSRYFENFYSSLIGHEPAPVEEYVYADQTGYDFLIITDPDLEPAAQTLASRRNSQGISTIVVNTTDTGTTAPEIKAYIQNAYDNWTITPSYLLLMGGAEHIPVFYHTVHGSSRYRSGHRTGTDLYYVIMNGPEASPPYYSEWWTSDIYHGRIPVDTLSEAEDVVDKIIEYEDNQWVSGENTGMVAGYFQDDDPRDGYEDRRFILTSEEIRDFLMGVEGYEVERVYVTEDAVTPTNYSNGVYDAGVPLPPELLRPTFPWDGGTADIISGINEGRSFVFHRDHGGSRNRPSSPVEGWGDPEFEDTDVASLTNSDHYTIVFSINCETGWFDSETDDNYTDRDFECLCEALIKDSDAGAAGVFGATRISTSGWNDDLAKGFVDAIWPNFDTGRGPTAPQLTMGEVLNYGKWYMYTINGWPWDVRQRTFELFHYFGDPTMIFRETLYPPVADADGPYNGYEGSSVLFDGSNSHDPDGTIEWYEWDWENDGSYDVNVSTPTTSHTYGDVYSGLVILRVTDNDSLNATDNSTVTIENVAPIVYAGPDQTVDEGDTVYFKGNFTDPGWLDNHTATWDWGDGSPQEEGAVSQENDQPDATGNVTGSHVYCNNGVYTVTLNVTDDDGGWSVDYLTITVNNVAPVITFFNLTYFNSWCDTVEVEFYAEFTDPGWCDTHTAVWDWGDGSTSPGSIQQENEPPMATGNVTGAHTYHDARFQHYAVRLHVYDDDGGVDTYEYRYVPGPVGGQLLSTNLSKIKEIIVITLLLSSLIISVKYRKEINYPCARRVQKVVCTQVTPFI